MNSCLKVSVKIVSQKMPDIVVQCEKCNLWLCCDCQSISPSMLNAIKQFQSLHWFCKSCEPSITKILNSVPENTNKSVEHRLQSMENHLAELTNNMNKLSSHWQVKTTTHNQTPVMETLNKTSNQFALKIVDEYKDREHRKLNLIFHKIPELVHSDPSAKHDHDKKFVLSLAKELGVEELEVANTTRIGQVKESRDRLLKVEVTNVSSKNRFCLRLSCSAKQRMKFIVRSILPLTFLTKREYNRRHSDQNYTDVEVPVNQICLFVRVR